MAKKRSVKKTICLHCKKEIVPSPEKRTVLIVTSQGSKVVEAMRFHIDCWSEYFNNKVMEKQMNLLGSGLRMLGTLSGLTSSKAKNGRTKRRKEGSRAKR